MSSYKNEQLKFRGCASRSPAASQTQLGRVKAICDLARLASGIIVVMLNKRSRIIMFDTIHYPQHLDKRHHQRHNMYNEIEPLQYNVDVI